MKKCELLSPAGNMEMLKYAVAYGADAVYLAGTKFGARKFADNFDKNKLEEAIEYAHLYGVKVYITLNTLIYEREIEKFIEYAKYIYGLGVDAVLVQDFGMLKLLHLILPDLKLHASTQMHNNGEDMIRLLSRYGVKRVVLDREMSLEEIEKLPKIMESEVFCHGALCVSYSGQCLFSSMILHRSGNRGECAGMCRLPYRLESGNRKDKLAKYYLCLKDLCTVDFVDKIIDSGVDSLKIEGRMKSPQYVGYITKIYRNLIDSYYDGNFKKVTEEEKKNIELLFNRGFTCGFMFNSKNEEMANIESPNHIGIYIGKYEIEKDKIRVKLEDDLHQGDTIRFKEDDKGMTVNFLYDKTGNLIKSAQKGQTVYVDNFLGLLKNGSVRKVSSIILNSEIDDLPQRKVYITGEITIKKGKNIEFTVFDGKNTIKKEGTIPAIADKRPISIENVIKQINKTGNTVYEFTNINVNLDDNLFVNIRDLNEVRRDVLNELNVVRQNTLNTVKTVNMQRYKKKSNRNICLDVVVNTLEQFEVAKKYATNIFTSNTTLFTKMSSSSLHFKYEEKAKILSENTYMISDYGTLMHISKDDIVYTDYMLNVVNSYSIDNLIELGAHTVALSPEVTLEDIRDMKDKTDISVVEVLVYGKLELMKMKYDPIESDHLSSLIDRNGKKYTIKRSGTLNYLISEDAIDRLDEIEELSKFGIKNYRVDFFDESKKDCEKILSNIHKKIFKE